MLDTSSFNFRVSDSFNVTRAYIGFLDTLASLKFIVSPQKGFSLQI